MIEDKDARLSGLYRESSREEPPARVDRAVMELARSSVRRRTLSPFGNHRVAAGALAGVCIVSILLVVLLPEQGGVPDLSQTPQEADAQGPGLPEKRRYRESAQHEDVGGKSGGAGESDVVPERFDFYSVMPDAGQEAPAVERTAPAIAAPVPRQAAPVPMEPGRAAAYVLQIDGFSSLAQAEAMQDKLEFMRLNASIQQGDGTQTGYRIRVGPYTDLNELDRVQARLDKRGIKSTRERVQ